jgi:predicted ATPase
MYLREDGGNFASYLSFLKKSYPDHYRIMLYTIRDVVPSFNDFVFNTEPKGSDIFKLLWEHKGSDISFNLNSLSEGSIRFIFYALLLNQPEEKLPSIIIIDEPELGLHPYAIHVLAGMLKSVSTKRQVIVSTQSTTFLNQFSPEDVIVTDRKDNESIFRRLSKKELKKWVGEYSLGELWEMNVLGGRP